MHSLAGGNFNLPMFLRLSNQNKGIVLNGAQWQQQWLLLDGANSQLIPGNKHGHEGRWGLRHSLARHSLTVFTGTSLINILLPLVPRFKTIYKKCIIQREYKISTKICRPEFLRLIRVCRIHWGRLGNPQRMGGGEGCAIQSIVSDCAIHWRGLHNPARGIPESTEGDCVIHNGEMQNPLTGTPKPTEEDSEIHDRDSRIHFAWLWNPLWGNV